MFGNVFPMGRQEVEPELSTLQCTHTLPSPIFLSEGVGSNIVIALWLAVAWPIVSQLVLTGARRIIIQTAEVAFSTNWLHGQVCWSVFPFVW